MVDLFVSIGRLLAALLLVGMNGFFVASEFAFVRVRATSVEQLVADGRTGAGTLQEVMDHLDDYLAVTQLGITIASLGLGWIGEPAVAALIEPVLAPILPGNVLHLIAFGLAFSFITFLHVVFGELAPKTVAIAKAQRLSLFVAPPMKLCYYLFYPGLVVFNGTANEFTSLLGIPPASETHETLEEREIRRVLGRAGEAGNVDQSEVEMIERVFDLDDTSVREVMVPQPDVVSVHSDTTVGELRTIIQEAKHTRYPVIESAESDELVGFIDVKDVLDATGPEQPDAGTAGDLARNLIIVPESATLHDLLVQFREEQQQMAGVIDEWGSFEGIATVEDVLESIVGDLRDEFDVDEQEPSIQVLDNGSYAADGSVPLSTVNQTVGSNLESETFDTVGGLVMGRLGRAPELGDCIEVDGYLLEVTAVDGSRTSSVRISEQRET